MAGYYDGLRIVETEHQLTTSGGTGTQTAAPTRMLAQQASRQPGWTGGSCLSSCSRGSAPHGTASHRQQATLETTLAWESPSQPPAAPALGAQHGDCRSRFWMMSPSAMTWRR